MTHIMHYKPYRANGHGKMEAKRARTGQPPLHPANLKPEGQPRIWD
jgi:hypothetical protein